MLLNHLENVLEDMPAEAYTCVYSISMRFYTQFRYQSNILWKKMFCTVVPTPSHNSIVPLVGRWEISSIRG